MRRWILGMAALAGCTAAEEPRDYGEPPAGCDTVGFEVGDCAPDFTLPSIAGNDVSIGDYVGERILVFGTSNW